MNPDLIGACVILAGLCIGFPFMLALIVWEDWQERRAFDREWRPARPPAKRGRYARKVR